ITKGQESMSMRRSILVVTSLFLCGFSHQLHAERVLQQIFTGSVGGYLIEGTDGFFYGTDAASSNLFNFRPDGTYRSLAHPITLNPEITLADDGNIYGTTRKG